MSSEGPESEVSRVRYLRDIGSALASTLDADEALRRLGRLLVPRFADWCAVTLLRDQTVLKTLVAHMEGGRVIEADLPAGFTLPPSGPDQGSLGEVLRGGPPILLERIIGASPPRNDLQRYEAELVGRFGGSSAMIVGLAARRLTFGALTLARASSAPPYEESDLVVADDIGRRAAMALENARLFYEQRSIAETLQRSLLATLPEVAPLTLGATYVPARQEAEVGGDWYDAFVLPDGAVTLIIGDVAGHDLTAAVRMSDVRSFLRSGSLRSSDPAVVMEQLDHTMAEFTKDTTATAIFARVERTENTYRLRWSNAGHLSPLLVLADGLTRYLDTPPDVLLGARSAFARQTHTELLPPGCTVLLYSDGLVEDPETGSEPGLQRLRRSAGQLAGWDPGALCQQLIVELTGSGDDDVAVIAVRVPEASPR